MRTDQLGAIIVRRQFSSAQPERLLFQFGQMHYWSAYAAPYVIHIAVPLEVGYLLGL